MSTVEELEDRIKTLSPREFQELRHWMAEYASDEWDRQIEADVVAGKLDGLLDQALKDHLEGKSTLL